MDAIDVLEQDHRRVEQLFERFEKAEAPAEKQRLFELIAGELATHTRIEEEIFYPAAQQEAPDTDDLVREGLEEHHVVDVLIAELQAMAPDDEQFEAKAKVLKENVEHHVEEEEGEMFPGVRSALDGDRLEQLGEELQRAKSGAAPADGLPDLTRDELYARAQSLDVAKRSDMTKEQLVEAIRTAEL